MAQLIPPPRRHRHHYHGVLAPNSPLRSKIAALANKEISPNNFSEKTSESLENASDSCTFASCQNEKSEQTEESPKIQTFLCLKISDQAFNVSEMPLLSKKEIAEIFEEVALFLELNGENPIRIQAYQTVARSLLNSEKNLDEMIRDHTLTELEGIGTDFAEEIAMLVETGHLPYYDQLKRSIPEDFYELHKVRGLSPKMIRIFYKTLKIDSIEKLKDACEAGDIANLPGFGKERQKKILNVIAHYEKFQKEHLWWETMEIASPILESLQQMKEVAKAVITGSYRRKMEIVNNLNFLVAASNPEPIIEKFTIRPEVRKVISTAKTKAKVLLSKGIQAELRIVSEEVFGFTLCSLTGSEKHKAELSKLAKTKGWSLNENGFKPLPGKAPFLHKKKGEESDVYDALGLVYVPPEMRENQGEIEAAKKGKIPTLVEVNDIRGTFHNHTTASDGTDNLLDMAMAAENLGWEYLGVSDHSKSFYQANGLSEETLLSQIEQIRKLNDSKQFKLTLFSGSECDILPDGTLDFPDSMLKKLDFVIVSVHNVLTQDEKTMTNRIIKAIEHPLSTMVGHITGRYLLRHPGYQVNVPKVIDACIANRKMIELNGNPQRLDMDWRFWHAASEKGLLCCINTDAHSTEGHRFVLSGVNIARKGWLQKHQIFNTLPLAEIIKYFRRKVDY